MVTIHALTAKGLYFVCEDLRPEDHAEILATRYEDQIAPDTAAVLASRSHIAYEARWNDIPVAIYGAVEKWPGVWSVFLMATDEWRHVALSVTRHALREGLPAVWEAGAHRLECASIETHPIAHRWLERLGFSCEARLPGYGRQGETFLSYARFDPYRVPQQGPVWAGQKSALEQSAAGWKHPVDTSCGKNKTLESSVT